MHVVLENGNCVLCKNRLFSALRERKAVQRVYSDFSTGCLIIEHEDDPDALFSLLRSDGRAVALASNGERVMVSRCPRDRSVPGVEGDLDPGSLGPGAGERLCRSPCAL
jgi:hypothetical protein